MSDCVYPCSCGNFGNAQKACTCAPAVVTKYQKRISGPILDRIDIHVEVPSVDYEKLSNCVYPCPCGYFGDFLNLHL